MDAQHLQTAFEQPAVSARNDAHFIPHFDGISQCITVFGVVAADEIAVGRRNDAAVGHHAVDVEYERLDAGYLFFEVFHICRLIVS